MKAKDETLKNAYLREISKAWGDDAKMMTYFEKKLSCVYELTCGKLFAFEKQNIKTQFCFGCGQNSFASEDEISDTQDMIYNVRNDYKYFMHENLKDINDIIRLVDTGKPSDAPEWKLYTPLMLRPQIYIGVSPLNIWCPVVRPAYDFKNDIRYECERKINIVCSDEDKTLLLAALNNERKKLIKRLNSYLKRNELKNIRAWTYISD